MDQSTHAWIAVRAVALLEDDGSVPELVKVLRPQVPKAAIGAWIPDLEDAKRGGAKIQNHVLKIGPYTGQGESKRFTESRKATLDALGPARQFAQFIQTHGGGLDAQWWQEPYKGEVKQPGQHVANRAMALSTTMIDLLLLGDRTLADHLPGNVSFAGDLAPKARTTEEEAALHFFMLSHFVADACMPCHCDARDLSDYDRGVHKEMEKHWKQLIGLAFSKARLLATGANAAPVTSDGLLKAARDVDARVGLAFGASVPALVDKDVWYETINLCRASFVLASIIAPPSSYPYGDTRTTTYDKLFPATSAELQEAFDQTVLHDAVLNVAIVWKHVWRHAIPVKIRSTGH